MTSEILPSHDATAPRLSTGTVTFLFTDVEGSTRLWAAHPELMGAAIRLHERILSEAVAARGGSVFKTAGDAVYAAFGSAAAAAAAAVDAQHALAAADWPLPRPLRVRMAVHAGTAERVGNDYLGPSLNRASRILSAAHGGQVLLSGAAAELAREAPPHAWTLRDLGEHRLKDLQEPERLHQLLSEGLESDFPPPRALDEQRHNLPVQPTSLIGREAEIAALRGRLRSPATRLLTLTGPGGTGKTRLALQAAAELVESFADGAWAVFLAPVRDPDLVLGTVARVLGLREATSARTFEALVERLRGRELLLVLDNFEQVTAAAPDVARLLAAAPGPRVLVTSREPLRISGEQELPVPPLPVPHDRARGTGELAASPAVALFVERARAVKPSFALDAENAEAVFEVCRRLDGLPLAIELAAARIRLLTPAALASRIGRRLELLTTGARDLPDRQRTLRGAIDWSHDLLDDGDRAVFRRLSAFASGGALEAVEAVCGSAASDEGLQVDLLARLESLVSKSLVRPVEADGGEPRFGMLETVREYAAERLEASGEARAVRRRHAEVVLETVRRHDAALREGEQTRALAALAREQAEIRQALGWTLAAGELQLAADLATAAWLFWWIHGDLAEARDFLQAVIERGAELDDATRARLLTRLGGIAYLQGDLDGALAALRPGLELARRSGDLKEISRAVGNLGTVLSERGELEAAEAAFHEALAINRELGDRRSTSYTLGNLGVMASFRGDFERARELHQESLAILREEGETHRIPVALINLGVADSHLGRLNRAEELLRESLELSGRIGARHVEAHSHTNLGDVARARGDLRGAREHLLAAIEVAAELGQQREIVSALSSLAVVERLEGHLERAARLGCVTELMRAAQGIHLGAADLGWSATDAERVREELGLEAFERARSWAASASPEQAIDYARRGVGV